jgi:HNH endonuclease
MANHRNDLHKFEAMYSIAENGCWEWKGALWKTGYGRFHFMNKSQKAHRVSWMLYIGDLPNDTCVLHSCDNRHCVNPEHLFIGDRADNNADKVRKGRQTRGSLVHTAKLTDGDVIDIRNRYSKADQFMTFYGLTRSTANKILRREVWKHV